MPDGGINQKLSVRSQADNDTSTTLAGSDADTEPSERASLSTAPKVLKDEYVLLGEPLGSAGEGQTDDLPATSCESEGQPSASLFKKQNDIQNKTPTVAHLLAQYSSTVYGLNLHTDSNESKFFCLLLDFLEKQQELALMVAERIKILDQREASVVIASEDGKVVGAVETSRKLKIRMQTLHRIWCNTRGHYHGGTLFEDEPRDHRVKSSQGGFRSNSQILRGQKPIYDLDGYIVSNPDIAFIVVKEHECSGVDSLQNFDRSGIAVSARKETLRIISRPLKDAIAECENNKSDLPTIENVEFMVMDSPYPRLYHNRTRLTKLAEDVDEETQEHINVLQDFLEHNYGPEYAEADEQFRNGSVSKRHLSKLFKPDEIILRDVKGAITTAVVLNWPKETEKCTDFKAWEWGFDGRRLYREHTNVSLEITAKGTIPITQLEYYPLSYASEDMRERLTHRGKRFWTMRNKYVGSYSGWDAHRDHFHVSSSQTYSLVH